MSYRTEVRMKVIGATGVIGVIGVIGINVMTMIVAGTVTAIGVVTDIVECCRVGILAMDRSWLRFAPCARAVGASRY